VILGSLFVVPLGSPDEVKIFPPRVEFEQ